VSLQSSPLFEVQDRAFKPLPVFEASGFDEGFGEAAKGEFDFGFSAIETLWPGSTRQDSRPEGFNFFADPSAGVRTGFSPLPF